MSELRELKVGNGWRYQCWICNRQVKIDRPYPKGFPPGKCPGCGAGGWWGHLVTTGGNGKSNKKIMAGDSIKGTNETMSGGVKTRAGILSQLPDAVLHGLGENNGVFEPSQGRERGRPRHVVPDDLILELAGRGLSSRTMVKELTKRGFKDVGYKTIQRRLKASLL